MICRVIIIEDAELDIVDLFHYVSTNDSHQKAEKLLARIEKTCEYLGELPERGLIPTELRHIGIQSYREILFKPYRIIYEISGTKVFIHCVLDGRRDLQDVLERRLLRE